MNTRLQIRQQLIEQIGIPVHDQRISVCGVQSAYLEAGRGTPLVLVHGANAASLFWAPIMPALAAHYRLIVPDLIGHGETEKPRGAYDRAYYSDWLLHFLDALKLDGVILVGNSMGGAITLEFARHHPERTVGLVVIDPAAVGQGVFPMSLIFQLMVYYTVPTLNRLFSLSRAMLGVEMQNDPLSQQLGQYAVDVLKMEGGRRAFRTGGGKVVQPFSREQLSTIRIPTLILWGEADPMFPVSHAHLLKQSLPQSEVQIIPKGSHAPFLDQPAAVTKALLQFLAHLGEGAS